MIWLRLACCLSCALADIPFPAPKLFDPPHDPDPVFCHDCPFKEGEEPEFFAYKNCSVGWGEDWLSSKDLKLHTVPRCKSKICYAIFATTTPIRDNPNWQWIIPKALIHDTKYAYNTRGCVQEEDSHRDPNGARSVPVYAPYPEPDVKPGKGQYVCRRNLPMMKSRDSDITFESGISCFCYLSGCVTWVHGSKQANTLRYRLQALLPETSNEWVLVNHTGIPVANVTTKVYGTPTDLARPKFYCGQCPCTTEQHDCPAVGRRWCDTDSRLAYTIETECAEQQCYYVMAEYRDLSNASQVVEIRSKGCGEVTDAEKHSSDYLGADDKYGPAPMFFAHPRPEETPGLNQWACRRNTPDFFIAWSISCFCFTSNCQTARYPSFETFKKNVNASLPEDDSWEYFDRKGNLISPSEVVPPPTMVPNSTTADATTPPAGNGGTFGPGVTASTIANHTTASDVATFTEDRDDGDEGNTDESGESRNGVLSLGHAHTKVLRMFYLGLCVKHFVLLLT